MAKRRAAIDTRGPGPRPRGPAGAAADAHLDVDLGMAPFPADGGPLAVS
jgi:hypothetical protein